MKGLQPIPETREVVEEYGPFADGDLDLIDQLEECSELVQRIVPECIAITLTLTDDGVSFTLVASDGDAAALNAIQCAAVGPYVESAKARQEPTDTQEDFLSEAGWQLSAQATAAAFIASTLTLPTMIRGVATGSIDLYATTQDAFTGQHEEIAEIFGAWAPGAVTNADLGFGTRTVSEQAPHVLREWVRIQAACGVLMINHGIGLETARALLYDTAQRAGITVAMAAEKFDSRAHADDE